MRGVFTVGLDVGGTKIEGVLLDDKGVVLKRRRIDTLASEGAAVVLSRMNKMVRMLTKRKVVSVGISFPGHIDNEGLLRCCPNIPSLEGEPLLQLIHRYIKQKVIVENDANCFALAEQRLGAGKGENNVVGVVLGTGIGSGIVANNRLIRGAHGGAGEIGYISYKDVTMEEFASGPAIVKRYLAYGGVASKADKIFDKKTLVAKKVLRETVDALAFLCYMCTLFFDPKIIVLGGGVSNAPIIQEVNKAAKALGAQCKIVRHSLGDASGALGAALLARKL